MSKIVSSLDSFSKYLKNNNVVGNHKKIIKNNLIGENGSGSFILDFLTRGKLSKNKKFSDIQMKLSDMDMQLGNKAYTFLDKRKNKRLNSLKNSFIQEHDILQNKGVAGKADQYIKLKRTGLSSPIEKTKNAVLPFAGSMAIGSKLFQEKEKDNEQLRDGYEYYE